MTVLANMFVIVLLTYYTNYLIMMLLNPSTRNATKMANVKMEKLRKISLKTVKQQKQFLNLKYPKAQGKFRLTWKRCLMFLIDIVKFVIIFRAYSFVFVYVRINLVLWQSILILIVGPIIINLLLEKFNLQKGDLRHYLR